MDKTRGVSLIELLISVGLISLALVVLIGVMIAGLETITKGSSYTEAATIAQSRMEKIIYSVNRDYYAIDDPNQTLRQSETIDNFDLTVTLDSSSTAYGCPYKKVIVEVKNIDVMKKRKGAQVRLETVFINKQ